MGSSRTTRDRRREYRNCLCIFALSVLLIALWLGEYLKASPENVLKFQSPSFEEPFFRIQFPFFARGDRVLIKGLELNGKKAEPFLVFKEGKSVALSDPLEAGAHTVVLDYAWAGEKSYEVKLVYQPESAKQPKAATFTGLSPRKGGIPAGREGFYRVYQVEEEVGIERHQEIVTLTLTAPQTELDPPDIVIIDDGNPIPFEILERMDSVPPEAISANHPLTSTLKIVLPIDAKAHQKKLILILQGDQGPAPVHGFTVSGEGLGKTIKGSKLTLELHPQSGQINTIESAEAGVKLFNKSGVIHWNPDVYIPGVGWDHSFDWNPPAIAEEKTSAYLYLNSRRGPLPRIKGVTLDVKYALEADAPYFISETRLNFEEGLGVVAVRNDEMVLFRDLFDSLFYKNKASAPIKLPLKEKEGAPFGLAHIAAEDLAWVGLINEKAGYGFFCLRLSEANANFEIPGEFFHKAGTYFYAPADGNYVYWVRPLVYTWADYFTNRHFTFVPRGSFFYEKNAYIVVPLSDDLPQKLDGLLKRLRHPLRVF